MIIISESMKKAIIERRRDLHKHPEPGWLEFRTASLAAKRMKELGYTLTMGEKAVKRSSMMGVPSKEELDAHMQRAIEQGADKEMLKSMVGGLTGFWAELKCSEGPTFALRFDMDSNDANECTERTHRPFKEGFASINPGAMHACGHDGHVAMGLAVAEILAGMKDKLKGTIRIIFQPAEEGLRGAGPMVDAGCVDGVKYIIGAHVGFQAAKKGDLVCGADGFLASTKWDVKYTGLGAHAGAAPQEGKNALLAACVASLNLHAISRNSNGVTRINVGKLVAGEGRNVVPPNALIVLETRGVTSELNEYMVEQAGRIVKASADMYDCKYEIEVMGGSTSGNSSKEMADVVERNAKQIPYFTNIMGIKDFGAGEDYAHMMSVVQKNGGIGTYVQIGADRFAGHHNSKFDFDEDGLIYGTQLIAMCVADVMKK